MFLTSLKAIFNYYLLASISGALVSFVAIIFLSYNLSSEDYVALGVFSGALAMMPSIIGLQTRAYFLRESSKVDGLGSTDIYLLIACLFWLIITMLIGFVIGHVLFSESKVFWYVFLIGFFQWFYFIALVIYQAKGDGRKYFITVVISSTTGLIYILFCDLYTELSWMDRAYGLAAGFLLSSLSILFSLLGNYKKIDIHILSSTVFTMIKYSLPLVPYSLSITAMLFFDRYFIEKYLGVHEAESYISMFQFVLVFGIFCDALYKRITPIYYKNHSTKIIKVNIYISLIAGFIFVLLSSYSFVIIFPERIEFNLSLFIIMVVAAWTTFLLKLVSLTYNVSDKNYALSFYTIMGSLITIVIMFFGLSFFNLGSYIVPSSMVFVNSLVIFSLFLNLYI